jgi:hypothetical protein
MKIDRFYCTKRQQTFELHYSNNRFMVIGDETLIDFMPDVYTFLQDVEHKPNHKLFKDSAVVGKYLTGLKQIWGLEQ